MSVPAISVILPAYNCSQFLSQTIHSLLQQTFTDFELLIINDGSTDDTASVIASFTDPRIQCITNSKNMGLVYTLNKGIALTKGKYIARMDADDVSLPNRFALQKKWLDDHAGTAMVACTVGLIDGKNDDKGLWPEDQQTITNRSIKGTMPWQNCIAHPSVMMRRKIALQYLYDPQQQHCEDYDLWLRLLADGKVIDKLPDTLLHYRVHQTSITSSFLRKTNPFFKQYNCKKRFLLTRASQGKWGYFEMKVLLTTLYDGLMGLGKEIKKMITR